MNRRWVWFVLLLALAAGPVSADSLSQADQDGVRQVWQMLDYVAVDYGGAVANGQVAQASEYAEMREFVAGATQRLRSLPQRDGKARLLEQADALRVAVEGRADARTVAALARRLAADAVAAYPIPMAPAATPDLALGAKLFAAECAACHGPQGRGDGPLAARLEPKPADLSDAARASQRSLFALYQAVSRGVPGTAMASFARLSDAERWALAAFAGTLSYDAGDTRKGERLWQAMPHARSLLSDRNALATATEAQLAARLPADEARAVMAYVRAHPRAVEGDPASGLALTRERLRESRKAFEAGDKAAATRLALSAYLDGFEPIEPALAARDKPLKEAVEAAMLDYRAAIAADSRAKVESGARTLDELLERVDTAMEAGASDPATTFLGALTILLREGLEALLVVVGMIAFLRRTEHRDALRYVHAGWAGALAVGAATWLAATYVVGITGASREVTEGVSSLLASFVLLAVGLWMHQKSAAGRWQAYLKGKLASATTRRSALGLFALAFVAVYREVFETVLFLAALWSPGNAAALVAGLLAGAVVLAAIAWVMLRTSARMPIGQFFSISSILVAILAVVLAGKGVAALQEAGLLGVNPLALPRVALLGIYPTLQTVAVQVLVALVAVAGFVTNARLAGKGGSAETSGA